MFLLPCPASSKPARIAIRPSASSTCDGYQRPWRGRGCSCHVSVHGSNVYARSRPRHCGVVPPIEAGLPRLPPATNSCPSASSDWPEQNSGAGTSSPSISIGSGACDGHAAGGRIPQVEVPAVLALAADQRRPAPERHLACRQHDRVDREGRQADRGRRPAPDLVGRRVGQLERVRAALGGPALRGRERRLGLRRLALRGVLRRMRRAQRGDLVRLQAPPRNRARRPERRRATPPAPRP